MQQAKEAMARAREEIKELPLKQQELMKKMMGSFLGGGSKLTVRRSEEKRKISGYNGQRYYGYHGYENHSAKGMRLPLCSSPRIKKERNAANPEEIGIAAATVSRGRCWEEVILGCSGF